MVDYTFNKQDTGLQQIATNTSGASYTWANKPAIAGVPVGFRFRASDQGTGPGLLFVSDGTSYIPEYPQMYFRQHSAISVPADTTEDPLITLNPPANFLGLSSTLRITTKWTLTGSTNLKEIDIRLGGSLIYQFSTATASIVSIQTQTTVSNRGVANSQVAGTATASGAGNGTLANYFTAIDTTAATTLVIAGKKASAGETFTLESALIELLP